MAYSKKMPFQYSSEEMLGVLWRHLFPSREVSLQQRLIELGIDHEINKVEYAEPRQATIGRSKKDFLVISSWNVRYSSHIDDVVQAIEKTPDLANSDVIALQEVDTSNRNGRKLPEELAEKTGFGYVHGTEFLLLGHNGVESNIANMLLSRHPLTDYEILRLNEGKYFRHNHGRFVGGPMAIKGKIVKDGREVVVYSTHLELKTTPYRRGKQLGEITEATDRYEFKPVIIAGDFNFIFDMIERPALKLVKGKGFEDPFGGQVRSTMNDTIGWILRAALDRIMSRGLRLIDTRIHYEVQCSDHYPITAVYRL